MPRTVSAFALLLIAPAAMLLTGCQTSATRSSTHIPTEVTVDKPVEGRPTLGMPYDLPNSDTRLVPFTVDRERGWLEDADRFTAGESRQVNLKKQHAVAAAPYQPMRAVGRTHNVRWHNAVFQPREGEGWLALEERGMISRFEIIGQHKNSTNTGFSPKAILITATVEDTNGDGKLTSADAHVLIAADKDGRGMRKITPPGTQVWDKFYNREKNLLLVRIVNDTDGDGKFTIADSAAPYIFDLDVIGEEGNKAVAKPLVDPSLAERAESLLK